jgi:hypothetical protein
MDVKRYKAGTLKGELTTVEIRKLIRAHNKASSIKIPPKSTREDIVGILQKAGYVVNHKKAELRPVSKGKVQKLKVVSQKTIAEELPKPKTKLEKQKAKEEKEEKNIQKKKQERTERKSIVQKALEQQEKTISKKTKPKPKPKTATISTQTEEPKKKRKMQVGIRFKSTDEVEIVEPNDTAIQKALEQRYKGFSGIERVKLTATQIKEMNDNKKRPIFDVSTPKDPNIVIVEAKVEGATNKTLSKVTLKKTAIKKEEPNTINKELKITLINALISIKQDVEAIQDTQLEDMDKDERKRSKAQLRTLKRLIDTEKTKGFSKDEKKEIENALDRYLEIDDLSSENEEKAKQLQKIIFKK